MQSHEGADACDDDGWCDTECTVWCTYTVPVSTLIVHIDHFLTEWHDSPYVRQQQWPLRDGPGSAGGRSLQRSPKQGELGAKEEYVYSPLRIMTGGEVHDDDVAQAVVSHALRMVTRRSS